MGNVPLLSDVQDELNVFVTRSPVSCFNLLVTN